MSTRTEAGDVHPSLAEVVERDQVWPRMAARYGGVANLVPPWKTSLDGLCDALDRAADNGCAAPGSWSAGTRRTGWRPPPMPTFPIRRINSSPSPTHCSTAGG